MSYIAAWPAEVGCVSAGNCGKKAAEAGENIADRKQDAPLKWFGISGLRPVFPKPARPVWMKVGEDVTALKNAAVHSRSRGCLCIFHRALAGLKAAQYPFSWSDAGVNPVVTFTVFHTWLPV